MDPIASKTQPEARFEFIGGSVCLDFANTVAGLRGGLSQEGVTSYTHLISWGRQASLITKSEAEALLRKAERDDVAVVAVLERAYALREAIYRIFAAIAAGGQPAGDDLETLNRELGKGTAGAHVIVTTDGFGWEWRKDEDALDQILGPLARSTATLLTSAERNLVRQCASASCGWLFVDATKNHRRQWCTTTGCGNKARVRRHRQRQRSGVKPGMEEERPGMLRFLRGLVSAINALSSGQSRLTPPCAELLVIWLQIWTDFGLKGGKSVSTLQSHLLGTGGDH